MILKEICILSGLEIWALGFPIVRFSQDMCNEICITRIVLFSFLLFSLFSLCISCISKNDAHICSAAIVIIVVSIATIIIWIYDSVTLINIYKIYNVTYNYGYPRILPTEDEFDDMFRGYQTLGVASPILGLILAILGLILAISGIIAVGYLIFFTFCFILIVLDMILSTIYMTICFLFNIEIKEKIKEEIKEETKEEIKEEVKKNNSQEVPLAIEEVIYSAEVV